MVAEGRLEMEICSGLVKRKEDDSRERFDSSEKPWGNVDTKVL